MLVWHIRPEQHTQSKPARTKSPDTDPLGLLAPNVHYPKTKHNRSVPIKSSGKKKSLQPGFKSSKSCSGPAGFWEFVPDIWSIITER